MTGDPLTPEQEERIREAFRKVPFAHLLGVEVVELRQGEATISLEIRDELKQNNGVAHGGVVASLVDTAAAFAILSLLEPGQSATTVDLTVHYLRPLLAGKATAQARVVRAGRRILAISAEVSDDDKSLVATALTSFIRLN